MPSRKLSDLHPDLEPLARQFLADCEGLNVGIIITCTYRSNAEQSIAYAQGRTAPGRIVTWARPGESLHNRIGADGNPAARAFDIVVTRHGKLIWTTAGDGLDDDPSDDDTDDLELWQRAGAIGKSIGLEWAGDWPRPKKEFPHFQLREA